MPEKYNKKMIAGKAVSHICADIIEETDEHEFTDWVKEYIYTTVDSTVVDVDKISMSDILEAKYLLVRKLRSLVLPIKQKEE